MSTFVALLATSTKACLDSTKNCWSRLRRSRFAGGFALPRAPKTTRPGRVHHHRQRCPAALTATPTRRRWAVPHLRCDDFVAVFQEVRRPRLRELDGWRVLRGGAARPRERVRSNCTTTCASGYFSASVLLRYTANGTLVENATLRRHRGPTSDREGARCRVSRSRGRQSIN